ncbi:MAG: 5-formyltetrahydrofolate cyclo-ligase [Elusimicrobiota bacterium]|nr:5-formyltetrahydrofolate cyclo-ligase [Elusimicrobiota bacterium]
MKLSEKELLRRRGRSLRKAIENRGVLSGAICERIINWDMFVSSRRMMSYCFVDGEVDLTAVNNAASAGELYLPAVVLNEGVSSIEARRFAEGIVCVKGKYGISEPPMGVSVIRPADIELVLVPGIMFSPSGSRIGFGCGYYDRFLSLCVSAVKAGVCFEAQVGGEFETDENDVRMDFVITEKRIYKGEK